MNKHPLNPKTQLAIKLRDSSAALNPSDLPSPDSPAFRQAKNAFWDALTHLWSQFDIVDHGYDPDQSQWYAEVKAPTIINNAVDVESRPIVPYHITGTVTGTGKDPDACLIDLWTRFARAKEWQRTLINSLYVPKSAQNRQGSE